MGQHASAIVGVNTVGVTTTQRRSALTHLLHQAVAPRAINAAKAHNAMCEVTVSDDSFGRQKTARRGTWRLCGGLLGCPFPPGSSGSAGRGNKPHQPLHVNRMGPRSEQG